MKRPHRKRAAAIHGMGPGEARACVTAARDTPPSTRMYRAMEESMRTLATAERTTYFHAPSNASVPWRIATRMKVATAVTSMNTYREKRSRTMEIPLMPIRATRTRLAKRNLSRPVFRPGPAAMRDAIPARPALRRSRMLRLSMDTRRPMAASTGSSADQSVSPRGWRTTATVCRASTPNAIQVAAGRADRGRRFARMRAANGTRRRR